MTTTQTISANTSIEQVFASSIDPRTDIRVAPFAGNFPSGLGTVRTHRERTPFHERGLRTAPRAFELLRRMRDTTGELVRMNDVVIGTLHPSGLWMMMDPQRKVFAIEQAAHPATRVADLVLKLER